MSLKNAHLPIQSCNQHYLLDSISSQRASSSIWTPTIYSSTSLLSHSCSSQADTDLLDPLGDIALDSDLDQRSASSATLLSRRVSSSLSMNQLLTDANCASSESDISTQSRQSRFLYPLREPGQMTAQRIQRLRARTAAVIRSIPATSEDVIDLDDHEPSNALKVSPVAPMSKLRRVSGVRDLRSVFRDGNQPPIHLLSTAPMGVPKASYELGILIVPTPSLSPLSPRSSLRTLVDVGNTLPKKSGDVKTLCESTLSSTSISSRFAPKLHSTFSPSWTSQTFLRTDTSQPTLPTNYHVHNLSIARSRRHTSLQLDTRLSRSPREVVWSCAKISQSAVKRAARCGHTPRRIFSSPIAALPS